MTITNSGNLQLNLDTDTDAFKAAPADELASILRHIACQIEDGMTSGYHLTDSNDDGNTAWSVDLPEPLEVIDESENLNAKYVEFIVSSYEAKGKLSEKIVETYADNFDEDLTTRNADVFYIEELAQEDTKMGPASYLFLTVFNRHLADNGETVFKNTAS